MDTTTKRKKLHIITTKGFPKIQIYNHVNTTQKRLAILILVFSHWLSTNKTQSVPKREGKLFLMDTNSLDFKVEYIIT